MHSPNSFSAPFAAFYENPKAARRAAEHVKLSRSLAAEIASRTHIVPLGPDPLVQHLISSKGFAPDDVVVSRVTMERRYITVLCVPTRVWRNPDERQLLLELKCEAALMGTKVVLVPQRWVRAEIRSGIARAIASARRNPIGREDLGTVLARVRAVKMATLAECVEALGDGHPNAIGTVLSMCAQGYLAIDRNKRLGPGTWVASGT